MKISRDIFNSSLTITYVLVTMIVFSVIAYLYFLNVSVVHVIMRKEATQEVNHLRTEIAILESEYIEAQHVIASRMGTVTHFVTETDKVFVHRDQPSLVLGRN